MEGNGLRKTNAVFFTADGYSDSDLIYIWQENNGVEFLSDIELSQFDLISSPYRNATISRKQGQPLHCYSSDQSIIKSPINQHRAWQSLLFSIVLSDWALKRFD